MTFLCCMHTKNDSLLTQVDEIHFDINDQLKKYIDLYFEFVFGQRLYFQGLTVEIFIVKIKDTAKDI